MTIHLAKPEHEVAYQDLAKLLSKHADKLSPLEVLAVAANMLGKLIALQDQRAITPDLAMETVAQNIERGNAHAIAVLHDAKGGSA